MNEYCALMRGWRTWFARMADAGVRDPRPDHARIARPSARGALAVTVFALALLSPPPAGATGYTFNDLSSGADAGNHVVVASQASAVNNKGDAVGAAFFSDSTGPVGAQGFLFKGGVFHELQGLPPPQFSSGTSTIAIDVNDSDDAAGTTALGTNGTGTGDTRMVFWPKGSVTPIDPGLYPNSGRQQVNAAQITAAGTVVGSAQDANLRSQAIESVRGGALIALTAVPSGFEHGVGLGDNGVAGLYFTDSGGVESSSLSNGTTLSFRLAPFRALNHAGTAAVGISTSNFIGQEWTKSGTITLPPLPGDTSSTPEAVNNSGDAVGYSSGAGPSGLTAVIWHNGVPTDLNTLVANLPYKLVEAKDVSDTGYIVGDGNGRTINTSPVWELTPGTGQITGTITTPPPPGGGTGRPLAQVTVKLSGTDGAGNAVTDETQTDANGSYSFTHVPGTYTVTPQPTDPNNPAQFTIAHCDGTAVVNNGVPTGCQIQLTAGLNAIADFTSGFTLTGTVKDAAGQGIGNVSILIRSLAGSGSTTTATTDATGTFKADLAAGQYVVETAPPGQGNTNQYYPVASTDCVPQNLFCQVNMDTDRLIEFTSCLVPNPDGSPLPPQTPDPIPGAVTVAPLEAIGCWEPQKASGGSPVTVYTTKLPIRLDGIDVHATNPDQNTVFTFDTDKLQVTASGDSQLSMGGVPFSFALHHLVLNYRGGSGPAGGAPVSVNDLGAGTGPAGLGINVFGLPVNIGTGGPLGFGLPLVETTGQTIINAGIQVPLNTRATWDFAEGKFTFNGDDALSIGVSGALTTTNRAGVTFAGCLSINDWKPFPGSDAEIDGIQLCYDHSKKLWTGSGQFTLPGPLQRLARQVNVQATLQNVALSSTHQLQGYKVQSFQIEFDHLNSLTYNRSLGTDTVEIQQSGIPLGLGFFLQKLGAGWQNNLSEAFNQGSLLFSGALQSVNGTFGISYGPEVEVDNPAFGGGASKFSLFRIDGKGAVIPPAKPGDPFIYQMAGTASLARLTPFELQLANGSVTFHADPNAPETDLTLDAGVAIPLPGLLGGRIGANVQFTGQSDVPHGILMDGTGRIANDKFSANIEVLFDCSGAPPAGAAFGCTHGVLVDCQRLGNGYGVGLTYDFTTGALSPSCDLGKYHKPKITPASLGQAPDVAAARSASVSGPIRLRLPRGLAATTLAIAGVSGAPRFRLSGPGVTVSTPASGEPLLTRRVMIGPDAATRTTYVTLVNPLRGTWKLTLLPGSTPVASIREADSQPRATVTASVKPSGCTDTARYRVHPAAGERIVLYAREGTRNVFVANLSRTNGGVKVPMFQELRARGKLIAYVLRGGVPVSSRVISTFAGAGSNGSETPRKLRLNGRELSWAPACGATTYRLTVQRGRRTIHTTTKKHTLKLPAGNGPTTLTLVALDSGGATLSTVRHRFG